MSGARTACALEPDPDAKMGILAAAIMPSATTYYVAPGTFLDRAQRECVAVRRSVPKSSRRSGLLQHRLPRCRSEGTKGVRVTWFLLALALVYIATPTYGRNRRRP